MNARVQLSNRSLKKQKLKKGATYTVHMQRPENNEDLHAASGKGKKNATRRCAGRSKSTAATPTARVGSMRERCRCVHIGI